MQPDSTQIRMLVDISQQLGELKGLTHQVHDETRKTNGRVTALEVKVQAIQDAKTFKAGYVAAITAIASVLATLVSFFAKPIVTRYFPTITP
jgi:hypothetical protein